MANDVQHHPERSRYELYVDGRLAGVADYQVQGEALVFPHTEIDPRLRGQGLGAVLVRGALDDVRASGRTIVARCWYVAQFVDEHPEYADLVR